MNSMHPELSSSPPHMGAGAPVVAEGLHLSNACAAPLDAVPCLSFEGFGDWLVSLVREGSRVASMFAVPQDRPALEDEEKDADRPHRLYAALAKEGGNRLEIACCDVRGSFPSLTPRAPQTHLFEREIFEKHGLTPQGHPWLKPVRFEKTAGPEIGSMDFFRIRGDEVHEVAVGPIHAGVIECGHFRFQCLGELVMHLEISLGYHHRGLEAHLRRGPNPKTLALMETLAGDSTIAHSWAYCSLVEALGEIAPSPRGQLVRSLALELERLANHTGDLGALAGDVGFLSTQAYCGRLRGDWLNMSAMFSGSRFGRGLLIPGGVRFDVDRKLLIALRRKLMRAERDVDGAVKLMWDSPSAMARLIGIGLLDQKTALQLGVVGVAARACGLERDVRHTHPMPEVPLPADMVLLRQGDVQARAQVRHAEIIASTTFCKRLLRGFLSMEEDGSPADACLGKCESVSLAPRRIAVSLVEGWRGEVCHVAITSEDGRFAHYSVVDPSFHNWMGLAVALRGQQISDFPICNKSFNLSYCGHDL